MFPSTLQALIGAGPAVVRGPTAQERAQAPPPRDCARAPLKTPPRIIGVLLLAAALLAPASAATADELARLRRQASKVLIVRDDWGIAHVSGDTDADAVFGMIYAQAEDDFPRIEANYLTSLGRTAEAEGEAAIWQDLRHRLFVDPADLKAQYAQCPPWLRRLMDAWADGLNYYLAVHPEVAPRVIKRFEPWMALSFTEGSIGGDIAKVSLKSLEAFYGAPPSIALSGDESALILQEPTGSNGVAISPSLAKNGRALLLINPHTSFYFRSELQMTSRQGLNVYGAATWGQFFIYQGFNAHAGWMHTTSSADTVDEFAETIVEKQGRLFYRYGGQELPVVVSTIIIPYRTPNGDLGKKTFTVYRTHHGPIVRAEGGKWIAAALMNRPVAALEQSFARTKARDLRSFLEISKLAANSTNDTLFADRKGQTALLLPQFMPRRDDRFDYTRPVDGSDPATDWRGVDDLASTPHVINPKAGWVYNSNDGPWWAAGADSPQRSAFPRYVDQVGENARTSHAVEVLSARKDFTLQSLIDAAYDSHMPAFDRLLPGLIAAYDQSPLSTPQKAKLREPVDALRTWDRRWSVQSAETSLAVVWGEALWAKVADGKPLGVAIAYDQKAQAASPEQKLAALSEAVDRLETDFGTWKTAWGDINRLQRRDGALVQTFSDSAPSLPVPFTSAQWGSLAAFGAKRAPGAKKYYGLTGNSFVAVVEFGDRVRARAVSVGGESGDPASKHFSDQAARYVAGDLREVYFYPDQLRGHVERRYRPGS